MPVSMRLRTLVTLMGVVLLGALLLLSRPAAAGGGGHTICRGFSEGPEVALLDNCFEGTAHFLRQGSDLALRNEGTFEHTYTAVDGSFDTGVLQSGESARISVPGPGTYPVYCTLHSGTDGDGMAGVLIVGGESGDLTGGAATASSPAFLGIALLPVAGFGAGVALTALAAHRRRRSSGREADDRPPSSGSSG